LISKAIGKKGKDYFLFSGIEARIILKNEKKNKADQKQMVVFCNKNIA
jgi:hypothetical protein